MKLSALLTDIAAGRAVPSVDIKGIARDSRSVVPGGLFVCIPGVAEDGHDYAGAAIEKGAAYIVCERDIGVAQQWIVPCARTAWARLCAAWFEYPADKLKLVGVTGTNGKTSTAAMIRCILEQCGYSTGMIGTWRNVVGGAERPASHTTPDPYELHGMLAEMVAAGDGYAVMEVSSHALEQRRTAGCRFAVGVFTNLTQDHLDYHGTMDAYSAAKRRLFGQCDTGVFNLDDPRVDEMMAGGCPGQLTFSIDNSAGVTASNITLRRSGSAFLLSSGTQSLMVAIPVPGRYNVYNALAAVAAALALGIPLAAAAGALANYKGVPGRVERVPTGRDFDVIIDYAHTPDGLEKVCVDLKPACRRLVTLFGCGGDRDREKRPVMGEIAARVSDAVIVTSDNPRSEDPDAIIREIMAGIKNPKIPVTVIPDRRAAIAFAIAHAAPGDLILLAGKGHETYQLVGGEALHLDEREEVAAALRVLQKEK